MHGLMSSPAGLAQLEGFIKDAHPGTEVLNVDAYNGLVSTAFIQCLKRCESLWGTICVKIDVISYNEFCNYTRHSIPLYNDI